VRCQVRVVQEAHDQVIILTVAKQRAKYIMIEVRGRITELGTLEVTLPIGVPAGDVTVRIEVDADTERPYKRLVESLLADPSTEPWGDLHDDQDVGDYIHQMRRASSLNLDETDSNL